MIRFGLHIKIFDGFIGEHELLAVDELASGHIDFRRFDMVSFFSSQTGLIRVVGLALKEVV